MQLHNTETSSEPVVTQNYKRMQKKKTEHSKFLALIIDLESTRPFPKPEMILSLCHGGKKSPSVYICLWLEFDIVRAEWRRRRLVPARGRCLAQAVHRRRNSSIRTVKPRSHWAIILSPCVRRTEVVIYFILARFHVPTPELVAPQTVRGVSETTMVRSGPPTPARRTSDSISRRQGMPSRSNQSFSL